MQRATDIFPCVILGIRAIGSRTLPYGVLFFNAGNPAIERTTSSLCDRSCGPTAPLCLVIEKILPPTHRISRAFSLLNVISTEVLYVSFVPSVIVRHSHAIFE